MCDSVVSEIHMFVIKGQKKKKKIKPSWIKKSVELAGKKNQFF